MNTTCNRCGAKAADQDSFCPSCGNALAEQSFAFAEILQEDGPHYCSQCGHPVSPENEDCPHCGAKIVDVLLGANRFPHPPKKQKNKAAPASSRHNFSWRWFFASGTTILLTTALSILAMAFISIVLDIANENILGLFFLCCTAVGIFWGAYIAAKRSPGITIIEPALAAAGLTVLAVLAMREGVFEGVLIAIVPFLAALGGARFGERKQKQEGRE